MPDPRGRPEGTAHTRLMGLEERLRLHAARATWVPKAVSKNGRTNRTHVPTMQYGKLQVSEKATQDVRWGSGRWPIGEDVGCRGRVCGVRVGLGRLWRDVPLRVVVPLARSRAKAEEKEERRRMRWSSAATRSLCCSSRSLRRPALSFPTNRAGRAPPRLSGRRLLSSGARRLPAQCGPTTG
jgi:hypothetical protein